MSGIRTGTRVEQLERLLARVQHELEVERLRVMVDPTDPRGGIHTTPETAAVIANDRRSREPVPTVPVVIKRWAFEQGLITSVPRGRIASALVEAYEQAHGIKVELEAAR